MAVRRAFIFWPHFSTAQEVDTGRSTDLIWGDLHDHRGAKLGVTRPPGGLPRSIQVVDAQCDFLGGRTGIRSLMLVDPSDSRELQTVLWGTNDEIKALATRVA